MPNNIKQTKLCLKKQQSKIGLNCVYVLRRFWTKNFGKDPKLAQRDKIGKLQEMGFDEETSREALEKYDWDENLALNYLLG